MFEESVNIFCEFFAGGNKISTLEMFSINLLGPIQREKVLEV